MDGRVADRDDRIERSDLGGEAVEIDKLIDGRIMD